MRRAWCSRCNQKGHWQEVGQFLTSFAVIISFAISYPFLDALVVMGLISLEQIKLCLTLWLKLGSQIDNFVLFLVHCI